MKRVHFIPFIFIILAAACYRPAPEPRFDMAQVLPEDTMVVLMTEMQLIDGAINLKGRKGEPMSQYAEAYSQQILERHGITEESFKESIRYYSYYIDKMNDIYEKVIDSLGALESEIHQSDQGE